jgi:hypothetical protein
MPADEPTPVPQGKHESTGMTSQVPFVPPPDKAETEAPPADVPNPQEVVAEETTHFQAAKAKALQDPNVQDLQSKSDAATGDDEKAATRRYYKALYEKMREIDPTIKDRIDRTEAASMRRLESEGQ